MGNADYCSGILIKPVAYSFYSISNGEKYFFHIFLTYLTYFLYLHIAICVQPMMEVKPCGIAVTRFACNPQVKVANSCIQLLYDGLILHQRLLTSQINAFDKKVKENLTWTSFKTQLTWVIAHLRIILRTQQIQLNFFRLSGSTMEEFTSKS